MPSLAQILLLATLSSITFAAAPPQVPHDEILKYVIGLNSDDYEARATARRELLRLATVRNVPFLYETLRPLSKSNDPELRRQARVILARAIPYLTADEMIHHAAELFRKAEPVRECRDVLDHVFRSMTPAEVRAIKRFGIERERIEARIAEIRLAMKEDPRNLQLGVDLRDAFKASADKGTQMGGVYRVTLARIGAFVTESPSIWYMEHKGKNYLLSTHVNVSVLHAADKPIPLPKEFVVNLRAGWPSKFVRFPDGQLLEDARALKITSTLQSMSGSPLDSAYAVYFEEPKTIHDLAQWLDDSLSRLFGERFRAKESLLIPSLRVQANN